MYVKYLKCLETFNSKTNSQIGQIVNYVLVYLITFFAVITWQVSFVKVTSKVDLMRDMEVQRDIYIYMCVCVCVCVPDVCVCVYIYIHIHQTHAVFIYIYIYIYI
jgi:hypothetical protein